MIELAGTYLLFQLAFGLGFGMWWYLYHERQVTDWNDFTLITFFPLIGWGRWAYKRELRLHGETEFPMPWYIWKKILPQNIMFLACLAVGTILLFSGFFDVVGEGTEMAMDQDHPYMLGFGMLADMAVGFVLVLVVIIAGLVFVVLGLIFILIPVLVLRSIERQHLKAKLAEERRR